MKNNKGNISDVMTWEESITLLLHKYETAERLRVATMKEIVDSDLAALTDGGRGVIVVEDYEFPVYVA